MSDDLSIPSPGYRGRRRPTGGLEPGTKLALIVAGVLGGTLVIGFLASGLMHRGSGSVPVVQADSRPIRVKPDNPGGLQVDSANNEIFSGGSDTDGSKLAPAPETPDPKAMRRYHRRRQRRRPSRRSHPPCQRPPRPSGLSRNRPLRSLRPW